MRPNVCTTSFVVSLPHGFVRVYTEDGLRGGQHLRDGIKLFGIESGLLKLPSQASQRHLGVSEWDFTRLLRV